MSRKVNTTIYLDAEQIERLKLLSKEKGKPMAELIRDGIDMVLNEFTDTKSVDVNAEIDETLIVLGRVERILLWIARKLGYEE